MDWRNYVLIKSMITKQIFRFRGIENLYCDMNGNFFFNNKPARKVYNNGTVSVMVGKSKKGIISLRKLAYKSEIIIEQLPF